MKIFLVYLAINIPQKFGYNYGLGYICSVLKANKHDVDYIVLKKKKDFTRFYESVREKNPGMIGFSVTTPQFGYLKNIAKRLREI